MGQARIDSGSTRVRGRARLAELIALVFAFDERDRLDERERRRLDEAFAAESHSGSGLPLLRAWLASSPSDSLHGRSRGLQSSLRTLMALFAAAGLFVGWAAAAALLSVEVHAGRVNIVLFFAVLVAVPFLTWLLSLVVGFISLGTSRTGSPRSSSPGPLLGLRVGLTHLLLRLLSPSLRSDLDGVLGRMTAHGRIYGRVERGQFMIWSQVLGFAFALGTLIATLAFVAFTDLAFGWSSTLDIEARAMYMWVHHVALPWAALWPEASPPLELVTATRFFRVSPADHVHVVDPIVYGGWWPFLVASVAFYGVLPRLLTLIVLGEMQRRAIGRAIGLTPGVDRLLDRLTTPFVEGRSLDEEGPIGQGESGLVPTVDAEAWAAREASGSISLICWAEATSRAEARALFESGIDPWLEAGGRSSLEADAEAIRVAASHQAGVAFCVRAHEPPVLDVLDFLTSLRAEIGEARSICTVLLGGTERDVATWRRRLVRLGDPRLVAAWIGETPSVGEGMEKARDRGESTGQGPADV